jgi:AcrR family transcriptional regulator
VRERIADERRQEILGAAYRLYVRRGLDGTTMQDIAAEVGLTAGALYRYYGNKDSLTEAVFAWCEQERFTAFDAAEGAASPFEAIVEVGRAAWREFDEPEARERMALWLEATLASYRGDASLAAHADVSLRHALERMRYVVELAQNAGELDPELDAEAVAMTLLAIHSGVQQAFVLLEGATNPHAALDVAVRMLDGLRPPKRKVSSPRPTNERELASKKRNR